MQFVIIVFILALIWSEIYVFTHLSNDELDTSDLTHMIWFSLTESVFFLGSSAYLGLTFYGLKKRKPYGRWMAVGLVGLILISQVTQMLATVGIGKPVDGPLPTFRPSNEAQASGQHLASVMIFFGLILLLARLIWGQPVKQFFAREEN